MSNDLSPVVYMNALIVFFDLGCYDASGWIEFEVG